MRTLVYRYGLLPPAANAAGVEEQLRRGHQYRNHLTEIERARRTARAALEPPAVSAARAEVARCLVLLGEARAAIRAARQQTRSRSETTGDRMRAAEAQSALRTAKHALAAARQAAREDAAVQAEVRRVQAEAEGRIRAARAASGLYWGSYLRVEQAAEQAHRAATEPRFCRWTGEGALSVQCQHGLPVADLATDRRVQVTTSAAPIPGRAGRPRPRLRLRIGSDRREPVWAEWPIVLHRPLPQGAQILWVDVIRHRIASREVWSAHVTLRVPALPASCGRGRLAVDLGWRSRGAPTALRAGYWRHADGRHGEIVTDPTVPAALGRVAAIRSERDRALDEVRPWLAAWLRDRSLPEWLGEATRTLAYWRAPARFAGLALRWRSARWDGDGDGYQRLESWRAADKRQWLAETGMRRRALGRRREGYRVLAATLARDADTLVLEEFDLRPLARRSAPEDAEADNPVARANRVVVAASELRSALRAAFLGRGGRVVTCPAADTTRRCHACGDVGIWDHAASITHTCTACGATWDQDDNACRNLLAAADREQVGDGRGSSTARTNDPEAMPAVATPTSGRWAHRKAQRSQRATEAGVSLGGIA